MIFGRLWLQKCPCSCILIVPEAWAVHVVFCGRLLLYSISLEYFLFNTLAIPCCPVLQYSLPLPKGGRHAQNPILSADQRVTYKPPRSRSAPLDALNPDYMAGSSPFAQNDVTSRGVNIAFRKSAAMQQNIGPGNRRVNPNASRGRRRKK